MSSSRRTQRRVETMANVMISITTRSRSCRCCRQACGGRSVSIAASGLRYSPTGPTDERPSALTASPGPIRCSVLRPDVFCCRAFGELLDQLKRMRDRRKTSQRHPGLSTGTLAGNPRLGSLAPSCKGNPACEDDRFQPASVISARQAIAATASVSTNRTRPGEPDCNSWPENTLGL